MARIVRSRLAKRDISDVLRFTMERWGKEQARIYRKLILDALNAIAADPSCGSQRFTVREGAQGYHIKRAGAPARHILFYRVSKNGIVEVIRLLHDSMDFDRHLPP